MYEKLSEEEKDNIIYKKLFQYKRNYIYFKKILLFLYFKLKDQSVNFQLKFFYEIKISKNMF